MDLGSKIVSIFDLYEKLPKNSNECFFLYFFIGYRESQKNNLFEEAGLSIFLMVMQKQTNSKSKWLSSLIAYWKSKNLIGEQEYNFLKQLSWLTIDLNYQNIDPEKLDLEKRVITDLNSVFANLKRNVNHSENFYKQMSDLLCTRVIVKNTKKPEQIIVYEKIGCPVSISILAHNNNFYILYPIDDKNLFAKGQSCNFQWGSRINGVVYKGKDPLVYGIKLDYLALYTRKCDKNHKPTVNCTLHHVYCYNCIKPSVGPMYCKGCEKYDLCLAYHTVFRNCEKSKYIPNSAPNSSGKCKTCKIHDSTDNEFCYYCNLNYKILMEQELTKQ